MNFEWDSAKSDLDFEKRGFDFAYVTRIVEGRTIEAVGDRRDYGELRVQAIGAIGGNVFRIVYTDRDAVRRIISARLANRKERRTWELSE